MKKVKVTVIRRTEYTKWYDVENNVFEDICEGVGLEDMNLAQETFEAMDEKIASEDWADENFAYASDYCIMDESGGVLVPFEDEL